MKQIAAVAILLLALLSGGAAHAIGPLGTLPPKTEELGSLSLSGGYILGETRLLPKKPDYVPIKARQNHYYVQAAQESFGWEWALRLGMADFGDGKQFEAGYRPFGGIGLKGNLAGDRFSERGLLASFRADVYTGYRTKGVTVAPGLVADVHIRDLWDVEGGLIGYQRTGRLTVYGGPFLRYVEAKMYRATSVPIGTQMTEDSYYKLKNNLGLAGGVSWALGDTRLGFEAGASSGSYSAAFDAAIGF
ncbi:MAG TPA: hypothetical protein VGK27_03710 [Candidatus Deferrimicrobiaceae bacterium]|jgi:hypothetical protein